MTFFYPKQALAIGLFVALLQPVFAQPIPKTMRRLPDTGQTAGFTNTYGEDADYTGNPPFFQMNGNGTVTDTVTGLMWQQADGGEMTFENAGAYCDGLSLAGYTDWRLPTAQEAFSILNHGKSNPALDLTVFADTGAEYWWTSESQAGNTAKIWVTNAGGGIGNHPKTETISAGGTKKFHVRAVRDVQPPPTVPAQFATTFNTAVDTLTGLEWQRFLVTTIQDSMTWEQALVFAENFVLGGKTDWRLPNIKELQSLNDETRSQPSLNTDIFPGIGSKKFWSSTSLPNQPDQAWFLDARFGVVSHELKTTRNYLLCVRGGNHATTTAVPDRAGAGALQVFPNPFSSKIQVFVNGVQSQPTWMFHLYDQLGTLVFSGTDIEQQDFSALPGGMYFLKISAGGTTTVRLLKM